jgi:hypothetical protein
VRGCQHLANICESARDALNRFGILVSAQQPLAQLQGENMSRQLMRAFSAALTSLALVACGGGGGDSGSSTPAPTTTFALQSAYRVLTLAGATVNYSISGTCSGTATISDAPAVAASFEGVTGYSVVETGSTNLTNCTPATLTATAMTFYDANLTPLGSSTPGFEYAKFQTTPPPLPTAVKLGDTATYGTLTIYSDSSKATVTGSRVLSYVIETDSATSVIVNLVSKEYDTANRLLSTQQSRYRLTAAGVLSSVSIDTQASTTSTTHLLMTKV